jgi:hypothetical protein
MRPRDIPKPPARRQAETTATTVAVVSLTCLMSARLPLTSRHVSVVGTACHNAFMIGAPASSTCQASPSCEWSLRQMLPGRCVQSFEREFLFAFL